MAIGYGTPGTADSSATRTVAPTIPGATGDYLVAVFAHKYANRTMPTLTGWTSLGAQAGGAGTDGTVDEGQVKLWVYGREKDGSEGATLSVTDTGGTGNCTGGRIFSFTKGAGETWDVVGNALAADNTAGASLAFVYGSDPGLTAGDWAVSLWCANSDAYTHTHAFSVSGVSAATTASRGNTAVTAGSGLRYGLVTHTIDAGTATGNATYTNTASGSAANAPAGASVLIRLRVTSSGASVDARHVQARLRQAAAQRQTAAMWLRSFVALRSGLPVAMTNQTFATVPPSGGLSGVAASNFHGASRFRLAKRRR